MKTWLTITLSLAFATTVVCGQDLPTYQSTISGQTPYYFNTLDNTLVPTVGTGTLVPSEGTGSFLAWGYTNDYFGNANAAVYFTNTATTLVDPTGKDEIYNSGTTTAASVGSMSLLFYTPNTNGNTATRYIFSNGDSSLTGGQEFYLKIGSNDALVTAAGNLSSITNSTTLVPGNWYYWACTWNFNGTATGVNGVNYYLGLAGSPVSSLTSSFKQRGGTGNISSSSILGNGGTFDISGTVEQTGGGFQVAGVAGLVEDVATWSNQLTTAQVDSQFSTLITIPEPSTLALVGLGGLLALFARRVTRVRRGIR
jgi:hypothetical protein